MLRRTLAAVGLGLTLGLTMGPASDASATPAAPSSVPAAAEPVQFYVFSFTETPVAEAAQDVVGSALGYELEIDPAAEGLVTFSANGLYSGQALLQDFGSALLDQDIALMRTGPGAYALIPRANVPMVLARGGVLMTLPTPALPAGPVRPVAEPTPTAVYGQARWWNGALGALLVFFAGALAGGAALFGGQTVYRRAEAQARLSAPTPALRLTDQRPPAPRIEMPEGDPDLIIPRFENRPRV
ncbi:hypothetical protein BZG35_11905 [Brevundimonas sp. LM2]|uniref:hypothetical protein n=1 Tax=Brevundimonas sp. LM2 TaxID=1938605 RepID=UPI000983DABF|nr:hypothetical protein [Brevundimonas sp. LM2]AQR62268.1 hypothetical protein BZG35_11905 [Brevundimonas sp. LM2]